MKKLGITDTSLRDAHQSLWATRMSVEDMVPIVEKIDSIGYHSLEVWGGATFDVAMRYLNEDPWERLKLLRQMVRQTKLQMLLRGQSLVGLMHYPDDIVEHFIERAAYNGIDIFRIFDALNDIRNLEVPIKAAKKAGKHVQACVVYTISPVHTMEHFVDTAMHLRDFGADSICIKDMAGLLAPYQSYELVKALKDKLDVPVQLHTHYIGGLAVGACLKAAEAGVDVVDAASVPLAFGSSQPPVETLVRALQGTPWDTGLNIHELFEVATYWEELRKRRGFERGVTRITDMKVFEHQVPGGMISNLVSQLEEQKAGDKLGLVLDEIPRVRADLGYPPLVTPTSQIVGVQAAMNVLLGDRYKMCSVEVKDYVRGLYGKPPLPIKEDIIKKIVGDEEIISVRPADLLKPGWEKAKKESKSFAHSDEDVLAYALFPQVAVKFFEHRKTVGEAPDANYAQPGAEIRRQAEKSGAKGKAKTKPPVKTGPATFKEADEVDIEQIRELIAMLDESNIAELELEGAEYKLSLRKSVSGKVQEDGESFVPRTGTAQSQVKNELRDDLIKVVAPMVGSFYRSPSPDAPPFVEKGAIVEAGQTLCIVEAMKLMNEIKAEIGGRIVEIMVENAHPVEFGQTLFLIEKE
ncbi:MAG: acetyl-CoA carboxylase biotin carboxyl carrier protein [Candidatus Saccharibacteria bacterium]